ncbi:ABC transporter permease [Halococcus sediminicola]|uniref:ABC transporter permease n=1 Tax=Halococcus sediminicola TaxID=1264579 RepID=UPI0006788D60|nr:ABC transporter permease [Halococcus sediminicola]
MSVGRLRSAVTGSGLRRGLAYGLGALVAIAALYGLVFPETLAGDLLGLATSESTLGAALRLAVPIACAAVGGIFAEKAGVINIGLEGLLIISAFTGVFVTDAVGSVFSIPSIWVGFVAGVLASTLLSLLFAVVCIEFRADQIIAGLAVWLIALGLAPFAATVVYGSVNTASVGTLGTWTIPVLSELPFVGPVLFDASPTVYLMFVVVGGGWYVLNRTSFGRHVRASGENPKALDTAGVDVTRVRYLAITLSGVLAGIGGVGLSLGQVGQFIGNGQTMVNGRGFIAIVAYLFGNYNPIGAFGAAVLFAGLDALQLRLQQIPAYMVPGSLIQTIPYITVIVVLALVGRTRVPSAAGEHYESGED